MRILHLKSEIAQIELSDFECEDHTEAIAEGMSALSAERNIMLGSTRQKIFFFCLNCLIV